MEPLSLCVQRHGRGRGWEEAGGEGVAGGHRTGENERVGESSRNAQEGQSRLSSRGQFSPSCPLREKQEERDRIQRTSRTFSEN